MENLRLNLSEKLTGNSFKKDSNPSLSPNSTESSNSYKLRMPQTKIGLGSSEGEMISLVNRYLEIVGLVVIVWIIGKKKKFFKIAFI